MGTNQLIDQINPMDREFPSTAVFQQFSKDPATGKLPDPVIGKFDPDGQDMVAKFKEAVFNAKQSAQGSESYEALNIIMEEGGLFDNLPTVSGEMSDDSFRTGLPVFITLSDGESRDRAAQRKQSNIDRLKSLAKMQIAVGVGSNFNATELLDFAQDEQHILHYDDFNQLAEAGQQIIDLIQEGCDIRSGQELLRAADASKSQQLELESFETFDNEPLAPRLQNLNDLTPSENVDEDFLEWPSYNRIDKRHKRRH